MTAAEALAILADLRMVEYEVIDTDAGDYVRTGYDRLVELLDTDDDDETIDAEHGDELAELTELDRREVLRWITLVRPTALERHAHEMNEAEDYMGGARRWIVHRGTVVPEGVVHRDSRARASRPSAVRPLTRARGRRRRSTTRRTPARSGRRRRRKPAELEAAA